MLNGSEADAPGRTCRASCITVIATSDVPLSHPKLSEQRADLTDVNVGMCTQRAKGCGVLHQSMAGRKCPTDMPQSGQIWATD